MSLIGLLLALCAQLAPSAEPSPLEPPPLQLAEWLQAEEPIVFLAKVERITSIGRGAVAATLEVEERLGEDTSLPKEPPLVLCYTGELRQGERALVFLTLFKGGPRYELLERIRGSDDDFHAKLRLVREVLPLLRHRTNARREAEAFELVYRALVHPEAWRRNWGVAELQWMDGAHPGLISASRRRRLRQRMSEIPDADLRAGVESVAGPEDSPTNP